MGKEEPAAGSVFIILYEDPFNKKSYTMGGLAHSYDAARAAAADYASHVAHLRQVPVSGLIIHLNTSAIPDAALYDVFSNLKDVSVLTPFCYKP